MTIKASNLDRNQNYFRQFIEPKFVIFGVLVFDLFRFKQKLCSKFWIFLFFVKKHMFTLCVDYDICFILSTVILRSLSKQIKTIHLHGRKYWHCRGNNQNVKMSRKITIIPQNLPCCFIKTKFKEQFFLFISCK